MHLLFSFCCERGRLEVCAAKPTSGFYLEPLCYLRCFAACDDACRVDGNHDEKSHIVLVHLLYRSCAPFLFYFLVWRCVYDAEGIRFHTPLRLSSPAVFLGTFCRRRSTCLAAFSECSLSSETSSFT
ncbi:hypothetical protein ABL78_8451 [Leptomonas seymouri]|uniref:Uncharacterized protein n=1 Tax=Leptomonas seymouri TaxID=5684 RepID=A0A0N1HR14_LEPSE|nr:hypothetical protein ABL78_8451 [Leptomonas seymouri]|eukprot:KPI82538.1 hypothetical protein ABL78_8451 [Leptomonas seymouri]